MKFENTEIWGFKNALRGMRNPKESWNRSDSYYDGGNYIIGKNDMKLAQALIRAGSEHRKFLRQIFVSVDITAPLYWWKEFDTYKVGTVANSTSTVHKLATTPITLECFETDDMDNGIKCLQSVSYEYPDNKFPIKDLWDDLLGSLEDLRKAYIETKDKRYWKELIRLLPESWLQKRTITMNYENLLAICSKGQRRFHKVNEWSGVDNPNVANFISWARTLPYAHEFIFIDEISE